MARKKTSVIQVMITGDSRDLQSATRQGASAFDVLAGAAVVATKVIASTATAIAGFSLREFAQFDDAMTRSTAIMGDLSDVMRDEMSEAARQVALATTFSASEAAEAFYFLSSAGLDAQQSMDALPQVAAFAQAGMFDLSRATDLLTDAQSALGLSSADAEENLLNMARVSDVLVSANTLANASVEQFSQALTERAGAAMRALGVDIEEGVAVLSVFADQGIKGSSAGTMLNTTLEGLTRTARTNVDAYRRLGVSVFDSEGQMRNMADIVGDLEGALSGMSLETQLAELATLGLTRQARDGVVQLLGNADAIRDYEAALRDAGGTTQDVADRQLQSFSAQLALMRSGIADIGISIGEALAGPLGRFVGWFQGQIPAIKAFVEDAIPEVERFVERSIAKFREFREFYDENLAEPLGDLAGRLADLAMSAVDFAAAFRDRAMQFLVDFANAVADADSEEAGEVLGQAVGDLIALAFANMRDFKDIVVEWADRQDWEAIGYALSGHFGRFAKGLFRGLTHSMDEETGELKFDGTRVAQLVVLGLVARIPVVRNMMAARAGVFGMPIVGGILRGILGLARFFTMGLGLFVRFIGRTLIGLLGRTFAATRLAPLFSNIGLTIQRLFGGQFAGIGARLLAAVRGLFSGFGGWLMSGLRTLGPILLAGLRTMFGRAVGFITGAGLRMLVRAIVAKAVGMAVAIGGIPALVIGAIVAAVAAIGYAFVTTFREWRDQSEQEFSNIGSEIVAFIVQGQQIREDWFDRTVTQWFRDRWANITNWINTQRETFQSWGISIIEGVIEGLKSRGGAISDWLGNEMEKAWNRVRNFLRIGSPSKLFAEVGEAIGDGLTVGIDDSAAGALAALGNLSAGLAGTDFSAPAVTSARGGGGTTVINVQVTSADPEAVVDAIKRYTRLNGPLSGAVTV